MSTTQEEQPSATSLMDEVRSNSENPLWSDEACKGTYSYPLKVSEEVIASSDRAAQNSPSDQIVKVGPFNTLPSPDSHIGPWRHAIDFAVEDGTPVYAMQAGEVFWIVDEYDQHGPTEEFSEFLNFITIMHDNGEFTEYGHLAQHSVAALGLKRGDPVIKGAQLGVTGMTGWTTEPHLHALVFRPLGPEANELPKELRFKSLIPKFETQN